MILSEALSAQAGPTRIIAEIKRASPSAGPLRMDIDAGERAERYQAAGAAALSVLTSRRFAGTLEDLSSAAAASSLPVMRKDFITSESELLEARNAGAAAALLIVRRLDRTRLAALVREAGALGIDALVECRDEREIDVALEAGATLVGINNRDLDTFEVDLAVGERLAPRVPTSVRLVVESGIRSRADVERFRSVGVSNFLVGEALSRASDPAALLRALSEDP
jgi:indole-3-glycerol phosphate synthase